MAHPKGNRAHMPIQKAKNFKKSLKDLIVYCKKYLPAIIFSMLFAAISAILSLIGPNKLQDLTNLITEGMGGKLNMGAILSICFLLLGLYSVSLILGYFQGFIMATVTQKVTKNLRCDISTKINKLPLKYIDSNSTGDVLSRITNDVDTIGQSLNHSIVNLISAICLLIGSILMMFITNAILAATAILSTILGIFIMMLIMAKSQKHFIAQQSSLGELNGHIEESYSGHTIIKVYNAEEQAKQKFKKINNNLYKSAWKSQFLSGLMQPLMGFIGNLGYVAVCVVGALLASKGEIGFGAIVAFMIYIRLFTQPLSQMAQVATNLQSAAASSERIFEFLNEQELSDEKQKKDKLLLQNVVGNVTFKNVRFGYSDKRTIIKNFSAQIKAGQKVAIVGPTGAGKTTMVNLLMRFYEISSPVLILNGDITKYKIFDNGKSIALNMAINGNLVVNDQEIDFEVPNELKNLFDAGEIKFDQNFNILSNGQAQDKKLQIVVGNDLNDVTNVKFGIAYYGDIFIDDKPVNSLTRKNIHDLFSMVLQDTWNFEGTIKENIVYSKQNVSDEQVVSVCKSCGIHHFIKTLPNGYNTILNDNITISAGQKQLLTIARAMIENSPMLILDEATSSVDTRTELTIQKAMDKLTQNRTSFVIAHRLSTIKNADQIIVMQDGDIVEVGNHSQLLNKGGFYFNLYNSQFEE